MWHTQTGSQVLSHFRTSRDTGLTNSQVADYQNKYGTNTLGTGSVPQFIFPVY